MSIPAPTSEAGASSVFGKTPPETRWEIKCCGKGPAMYAIHADTNMGLHLEPRETTRLIAGEFRAEPVVYDPKADVFKIEAEIGEGTLLLTCPDAGEYIKLLKWVDAHVKYNWNNIKRR
jgi:hypothetical protein